MDSSRDDADALDPHPDIHDLFRHYSTLYFDDALGPCLLTWSSKRMTLCAGVCHYELGGGCEIRLSEPLLKFRSSADVKNTLLHEMIHAYLWITNNNKDHSDHGSSFQKLMNKINSSSVMDHQRPDGGYNITIFHSFRDEVDSYRVHHWVCQSCGDLIKRAMNREPSPSDCIVKAARSEFCGYSSCHWHIHKMSCGGEYKKIAEPPGYKDNRKRSKGNLGDGASAQKRHKGVKVKNEAVVHKSNTIESFYPTRSEANKNLGSTSRSSDDLQNNLDFDDFHEPDPMVSTRSVSFHSVFMASRVFLWNFIPSHGHGRCSHYSNAHLHFRPHSFLAISCKRRPSNLRSTPFDVNYQPSVDESAIIREVSHSRRHQAKKIPCRSTPFDVNYQPSDGESAIIREEVTDMVSDSHQDAESIAGADTNAVTSNSNSLNLSVETKSLIESASGGDQLLSIQLENLIGMIRNTEKNVLLLNDAHVHALEDLDKILIEKEALQGQINDLEMRMAEAEARIKGVAKEKIHEFLENQVDKQKNEMSENDEGSECDKRNLDVESPIPHAAGSTSPIIELDLVRKENMSLKGDIQTLRVQLTNIKEMDERILLLEKERSSLEAALKQLAQEDVTELSTVKNEFNVLQEKVENLQELLHKEAKQASQAFIVLQQNHWLQKKIDRLEASLEEANSNKSSLECPPEFIELLQQKVELLEEHIQKSDEKIQSHVQMYQDSVNEFQGAIDILKEESKKRAQDEPVEDLPWEFWSRLLLSSDAWLLEKKISSDDAKLLRDMAWKRDARIRDACFACKDKGEHEALTTFLKLVSSRTRPKLHVVHIAAEMAPAAKVGGLGDVVSGLSKALQKKGHLVEIVLPKYDCMQYDHISDLKALDVVVESYFDGQLFRNKVWVGTIEGLPVYLVEPLHPAKFFWRGQFYGEHDDFKRFSFFSRAALELLLQASKKPDIIHCHDWQTAFIAPLYWDVYARKGLNSARICFTCHNFEYQGTAPASELGSCGLDVNQLNKHDRMQDNAAHDRVNPVKGAIVFSNIVTTVSPTYAKEVRTAEGGHGLHSTIHSHSKKFVGILNGIDTDAWDPSTDIFLRFHYTADALRGKAENKDAIRKLLKLSKDPTRPLVGCITRLVPQKGVHLIRHAMYQTVELGGQFLLLGSSPEPHIQRDFEGIANHFKNNPHVRLILKYDEALSHSIYAASDMFIIPSIFEPCGLTQMIAMRYGSVPIVRKTGGLNDSVFDIDDDTIPLQFRNGFTFLNPDEQGVNSALERAFNHYMKNIESWQQLVQRNMKIDFSWDSSAAQYEELYEKSIPKAKVAASHA